MKKSLLAAAALLLMAGLASAAPLKLTDQQLDQTAAGGSSGNGNGNGNGGSSGSGSGSGNLKGSTIIFNRHHVGA